MEIEVHVMQEEMFSHYVRLRVKYEVGMCTNPIIHRQTKSEDKKDCKMSLT